MGGFEMDNFDWIEREEKYDQLFDGMYDFEFDDFKKCIIEVLRDATRSIRKFQWGAYVLIGNIRAGKKNFTDADMQELLQLFELDYYKVEKYLEQFKGLDDSETEKYLRKKLREIRGEVARPADVIPFNLLKSLKIKKENDE